MGNEKDNEGKDNAMKTYALQAFMLIIQSPTAMTPYNGMTAAAIAASGGFHVSAGSRLSLPAHCSGDDRGTG